MPGLIVLLLVAFVVWRMWTPGMAWAPEFATLLERPVSKTGLWPFIKGLETVGGDFNGRTVLLVLHHKRARHSLGYLVIAMQPRTASAASTDTLTTLTEPDAREPTVVAVRVHGFGE